MSIVNRPAVELQVFEWVQGEGGLIKNQQGNVIMVVFFQINCPGCFTSSIPEIIKIHNKFKGSALVTWGVATAFEDFKINTLDNLNKLLQSGEAVGETLIQLTAKNILVNGCLPYRIPFPVAWDTIVTSNEEVKEEKIIKLARRDFPDFDHLPPDVQTSIIRQAKLFLQNKTFDSKTFDSYELHGTPSTVLIDKRSMTRYKFFGSGHDIESSIKTLLAE